MEINQTLMKTQIILTGWWILCGICTVATGQTRADFRQQFEAFQSRTQTQFYHFRDSVNREYARYLSQRWEAFDVRSPQPAPEKPEPAEAPRYVPGTDNPPAALPVDSVIALPYRTMEAYPSPVAPSEGAASASLRLEYFGVPVEVSRFDGFNIRLSSIDETQVADCWLHLSQAPCHAFVGELLALKNEMFLNDWALYLLLSQIADHYFQPSLTNEKTVFVVFMLNQIGYRAKVGRMEKTLVSLIAFPTLLYGIHYVAFPDGNYYVFGPDRPSMTKTWSYALNYGPAETYLSLAVTKPFRLSANTVQKTFIFENKTCTVEYSPNLIDLYRTCPQTELQVYANSALSGAARRSLEKALLPRLQGKNAGESVGLLLSFVQSAFAYKNDWAQFGYEKYFFVEESLHYPYSDCEDRAVLFAQLVRCFVGLDVVLLDYADHVSTAVRLNEEVAGDYVYIDNVRYVVCDPTYIGAPVGRAMKECKNKKARILALN
ncbi:MAG: hypothetical protein LBF85_01675 [Tannerella sp.]|jgi:hypothetical protein|nr:hypothetical protein [Tannerella sp.]